MIAAALVGATEAVAMLWAFGDGGTDEDAAIDVAATFCAAGLERAAAEFG